MRSMTRIGNRIGVALYERWGARLSGGSVEAPVLLLTVPGRRTGLPRRTCVRCLVVEGGWLVWGTGSGSPTDPDWFRNLRAAGRCLVRQDRDERTARCEELQGPARKAAWRQVLTALPSVERFERKAGRTIPVALLTPMWGDEPA